MTIETAGAPRRCPGRLFLLLGLSLAALGVIGYGVQLSAQHLTAPWYLPSLATLGVVFLVAALWQRRTVWRVISLVLVVLLAAAAWGLLLLTRLPVYAGPVAAGQPLPAFATTRADGTPFTERDLEGGQSSVLVFFRGRW